MRGFRGVCRRVVRDSGCLMPSVGKETGASWDCSNETDVAISHSGSAIISESFPEPIFTIIRDRGEGLRATVCPVFKLNVNSFV